MLNFENIFLEHYPEFAARHKRTAKWVGKLLSLVFFQRRFEQFESQNPALQGFDFVEAVLKFFDFHIRLRESERARIPSTGKVVIVANHPIGSLDGIALLHLVRQIRPDVKVVANSVLMQIAGLRSVLLPVDNMGGKTPRQNLINLRSHVETGGALIIFPAGEVSRFGAKGIRDGVWQSGFVKIASATQSPILPIFVGGRNSIFFYGLSILVKPLSTAWLIREMFSQSHKTIQARVGRTIPHDVYAANDFSAKTLATMFKKHVYRLQKDHPPLFDTVETVAPAESKAILREELAQCEDLGTTPDGKRILLTTASDTPCIMREIGRLREMTFRLVGEGSGLPRDIDRFDNHYYQLILWDDKSLEIVGAYRLGDVRNLLERFGEDGIYTSTLFKFDASMKGYFDQGLELGRSFVQPRYQSRHALDYLWFGIGAFVKRNPHIRYLFGPASISRYYDEAAVSRIAFFYSENFTAIPVGVSARNPFEITNSMRAILATEFAGIDLNEDLKSLKDSLAESGLALPILYKHYAQTTEHNGVTFSAFNKDPDFGDCVDSFVIADLSKLKPKKRKRYLGEDWAHAGNQT